MSAPIATTRLPGLESAHKILRFMGLPAGWKYGAGVAPSAETVRLALTLNRAAALAGLETDAFLGLDGEIRVTVYHRRSYLQFTIEGNGLIEYVREEGNTELLRVVALNLENALLILRNFQIELWHSSVSSTVRTMITTGESFKTSPSRLPDAVRVFRSLSGSVPLELVIQSADT